MTAAGPKQAFDLSIDRTQHEGLVRTVRAQVKGISHQDAEDAVQDAWIVLAQKANQLDPGPVGGFLMRTARFKALKMRDRGRGSVSLDSLTELAGDGVVELTDQRSTPLDIHVELADLARDPVGRKSLAAANLGASGQIAPRGSCHPNARYTDEQVTRVRSLRSKGFAYRRIDELTGVPANYCAYLVRRCGRLTKTTAGWTPDLVLGSIRRFNDRHGKPPKYVDAAGDPMLPSPGTAERYFGSWRDAVRAAGLKPVYNNRRISAWSREEVVETLCSWRVRNDRWPGGPDLESDPALPSPATTKRRLGTQSSRRLGEVVLGLLA